MKSLNRASLAKELLELCEKIASLLGTDKIKVNLSRHGGEIVHKTPHGLRRLLVGPRGKIKTHSIKRLGASEQYFEVKTLRE